jgi:hypothetical protein
VSIGGVDPSLVRYEMRMVSGQDPRVREQKKPGFFGRLLSGLGKVLGAVAMPLSLIFPPAAIAAAGMYGVGQIGDQMQGRAAQRAAENAQKNAPQQASFPGLEIGGAQIEPASFDLSMRDRAVMNVLGNRGTAMNQMAQQI